MPEKMVQSLIMSLLLGLSTGCAASQENGNNLLPPDDPQLASGPEFLQGRFKIYTLYRPQVQHRDFNGVFDINPGSARIVRRFWKEKYTELTRPGHYGEFFIEFYDYMSSFAQAYPVDTREKERMLDTLEKSFHAFCHALDVAKDFEQFQQDQQRIYGD
jgi:hypothetical protein